MTETDIDIPALTFSAGLPGFPGTQKFALVQIDGVEDIFLLRSLDPDAVEFIVAPPALFFPDYSPELPDAAVDRLNIETADDVLLLVMLSVGDGIESATANLLAPIAINQRTLDADQVVLNGTYSLREPVKAAA
jgi:flagellar assembly factor FliW